MRVLELPGAIPAAAEAATADPLRVVSSVALFPLPLDPNGGRISVEYWWWLEGPPPACITCLQKNYTNR